MTTSSHNWVEVRERLAEKSRRYQPENTPPLTVVIHGPGPASGKTVLQMLLAEFLSKRGHKVQISDGNHISSRSGKNTILNNCMKRRLPEEKVAPMPVTIHVSDQAIASHNDITGKEQVIPFIR